MLFRRAVAALLVAGFVIFAGCGPRKEARDSKRGSPPPVGSYVLEIEPAKYVPDMEGIGRVLISPAGDKAVFSAVYSGMQADTGKLLLADLKTGKVKVLREFKYQWPSSKKIIRNGKRMEVADISWVISHVSPLAWTPDGKKVLASSPGLFLIDVETGELTKISDKADYGRLSPDGARVVYREYKDSVTIKGLFVTNVDGTGKKQLTFSPIDTDPVWYPDSKHVFYFGDSGQKGSEKTLGRGLVKVSVADGRRELLMPEYVYKYNSTYWLAPGEVMYVYSATDSGQFERIYNLKNKKYIEIDRAPVRKHIVTALDEKNGLLLRAREGKVEFYNAAGKIVKSYPAGKPGYIYAVSPDGSKVAYFSGIMMSGKPGEILVADINGWKPCSLTKSADYNNLEWMPDSKVVSFVEVSPGNAPKKGFKLKIAPVK